MSDSWAEALVRSIHGGPDEPEPTSGPPDFDGGVRSVDGDSVPRVDRRRPPSWPSDELGWGPETELEDGAPLLFPWLRGK